MAEFDTEQPFAKLLEAPEAYCEAWPNLPLKALTLDGLLIPLVMDSLAKVTRLTSLEVTPHEYSSMELNHLATALSRLTSLECLEIDCSNLQLDAQLDAAAAVSCIKALTHAHKLSKLLVRKLKLPRAAAQHVTELQQLTKLDLERCSLDDYFVNVIALHLTGGVCLGRLRRL